MGKFIILTGPSGCGKTATADQLKQRPDVEKTITCTTRGPREEEIDGVHYHFMKEEEFQRAKANGEFIETFQYAGHNYGTRFKELNALSQSDKNVVFVMEINGAREIKRHFPKNTIIIYLKRNVRDLILAVLERKISNEEKADRILQMEEDIEVGWMDCIDYRIENETGKLDETVAKIAALL